ncbi:MAG: hypothetical protein JXA46_08165 [Dehalococcoidales bacterium]|nr:hypothetical protein [Dehalococcoidales bacterium]
MNGSVRLLEEALEAVGGVERPAARSEDYISIAAVYLDNGWKDRGLEILGMAASQADRVKLPGEKAIFLARVGRLFRQAGDVAAAKEFSSRAVLLARAAETPSGQAEALFEIGWEYARSDLPDEAAGVLETLHGLASEPKNGLDTALDLIEIAELYLEIDKPDVAGKMLDEAIAAALEIKDLWFKIERLIGISEVYIAMEDRTGANAVLDRVYQFLQNVPVIDRVEFSLRIADIHNAAGERLLASEALKAALESVEANSEAGYQADSLLRIAGKYLAEGEKQTAAGLIDRSLQKNTEIGDFRDKVNNLIRISALLDQAGERDRAVETASLARELCTKLANKKDMLYPLGNLAVIFTALGQGLKSAELVDLIALVAAETRIKTSGLGTIAIELAEAGELDGAVRLAGLVREPHTRVQCLTGIAELMAER